MKGFLRETEVVKQLVALNESKDCQATKENVLEQLLPWFKEATVHSAVQEHA